MRELRLDEPIRSTVARTMQGNDRESVMSTSSTSRPAAEMKYRRVPLTMIPENVVLASAVFDNEMRLLLGNGVKITQELILGLHKRGVRTVTVTEGDWQRLSAFSAHGKARQALPNRSAVTCDVHTDATRGLDLAAKHGASCEVVPSEDPYSQRMQSWGTERYDRRRMDQLIDQQRQAVDQVQNLLEELHRQPNVDPRVLQNLSRDSLIRAAEDLDLFVCLGINPTGNSTIFTHSTNVAALAVALGVTLGLDEEALCDLGTGCLVHDAGMLHIDPHSYQSKHVLDAHEFVEIAKHPIIAADLLYKNMQQVPVGVRMIVYQMHERCDGSGYPRGSTAAQIHSLAKIAMVADAYVALVSERPHRPALLPYHAVAKMLSDVRDGLFDSTVVRALLHTISLFPIGSFVELGDGRVGKTIRANGPAYDRPIVETWQRTNLSAAPQVVDLLEQEVLRVAKPLTALH